MFQYIKRNILRGGVSPNNDFCFLADQLMSYERTLIDTQTQNTINNKINPVFSSHL